MRRVEKSTIGDIGRVIAHLSIHDQLTILRAAVEMWEELVALRDAEVRLAAVSGDVL
jgi:hypothetical protein